MYENAKFYLVFITLILIVLFCTGCCNTVAQTTKTVVSTDVVQVKVPVACQFPKIACNFDGEGFTPTEKLLECVVIQKQLMDACSVSLENNTTAE